MKASNKVTATLNFEPNSRFKFMALYLGSREDALAETFVDLYDAMQALYTPDEVRAAFSEVTYFDAIVWFTETAALKSREDFLQVVSLPPLETRSTSRRKVKSVMVTEPVSPEGINELTLLRHYNVVTQIEWKAHGGVLPASLSRVKHHLYTNDLSPLLRGELYEMHFGNSYNQNNATPEDDASLVRSVQAVYDHLQPFFTHNGNAAYIGYVDSDLAHPGVSYFGAENTVKLRDLLLRVDPTKVLRTNMSEYLFGV